MLPPRRAEPSPSSLPPAAARPPPPPPLALPPFPSAAAGWGEAARDFFTALPTPHACLHPPHHPHPLVPPPLPSPPPLSSAPPLPTPPPPTYDPASIVATFPSQIFLSPRGKFDVHLTPTSLIITSDKPGQSCVAPLSPSSTLILRVPDINRKDDCVVFILSPRTHCWWARRATASCDEGRAALGRGQPLRRPARAGWGR